MCCLVSLKLMLNKDDCMQLAEQNANVRDACIELKELSADEKTRLEAEMLEIA